MKESNSKEFFSRKENMGLKKWFTTKTTCCFCLRTWVRFLSSILGVFQTPVILALRESDDFFWLLDQDWSKQGGNKRKNEWTLNSSIFFFCKNNEGWCVCTLPAEVGGLEFYRQQEVLGWKILCLGLFSYSPKVLITKRGWWGLVREADILRPPFSGWKTSQGVFLVNET